METGAPGAPKKLFDYLVIQWERNGIHFCLKLQPGR